MMRCSAGAVTWAVCVQSAWLLASVASWDPMLGFAQLLISLTVSKDVRRVGKRQGIRNTCISDSGRAWVWIR